MITDQLPLERRQSGSFLERRPSGILPSQRVVVDSEHGHAHGMFRGGRHRMFMFVVATILCVWFVLLISMHQDYSLAEHAELDGIIPAEIHAKPDFRRPAGTGVRGNNGVPQNVPGSPSLPHNPSAVQPPSGFAKATHLIMVAGHTIFQGTDYAEEGVDVKDWVLLDYQSKQLDSYLQHIRVAVGMAARDEDSLVVFSGGATRPTAGPRSEALSYWLYADAQEWFGFNNRSAAPGALAVRERVHTEEFARDSFQNLLFSICRFRQLTSAYPSRITVVSLPFKEERFRHLHRAALRFPEDRFVFVGVGDSTPEAVAGERKNSLLPFTSDPYGCHGSLKEKRDGRNPWRIEDPYPKGCPELAALFAYCGATAFPGRLPWDPAAGQPVARV